MRLALLGAWLLCVAGILLAPIPGVLQVATAVVVGLLFFIAGCLWRIDEPREWTEQDQTAYEVYTEWMSER